MQDTGEVMLVLTSILNLWVRLTQSALSCACSGALFVARWGTFFVFVVWWESRVCVELVRWLG